MRAKLWTCYGRGRYDGTLPVVPEGSLKHLCLGAGASLFVGRRLMTTGRPPRDAEDQSQDQIEKWKTITQAELRELLTLLHAGSATAEGEDRERYDAAVDRFIQAMRELRAATKARYTRPNDRS